MEQAKCHSRTCLADSTTILSVTCEIYRRFSCLLENDLWYVKVAITAFKAV